MFPPLQKFFVILRNLPLHAQRLAGIAHKGLEQNSPRPAFCGKRSAASFLIFLRAYPSGTRMHMPALKLEGARHGLARSSEAMETFSFSATLSSVSSVISV